MLSDIPRAGRRSLFAASVVAMGCGRASSVPVAPVVRPPAELKPPGTPEVPTSGDRGLPKSSLFGEWRARPSVPATRVSYLRADLRTGATLHRSEVGRPLALGGVSGGWGMLDDHAPRGPRFAGTVSSLMGEDLELAPGVHRLFFFRDLGSRTEFDVAWFRFESSLPLPVSVNGCALIEPGGTYNGPRALEALSFRLVADDTVDQAELSLASAGESSRFPLTLETGEPGRVSIHFAEVSAFPSGDSDVVVSCSKSGRHRQTIHRTITSNPELVPPRGGVQ